MTVFTIVKRGTFDGKSGHTDKIFDTAAKMIASNDVNYVNLNFILFFSRKLNFRFSISCLWRAKCCRVFARNTVHVGGRLP